MLSEQDNPIYLEAMRSLQMDSDPLGGEREVDLELRKNSQAFSSAKTLLKEVAATDWQRIPVTPARITGEKKVRTRG
jgi:hypothetical protein